MACIFQNLKTADFVTICSFIALLSVIFNTFLWLLVSPHTLTGGLFLFGDYEYRYRFKNRIGF